LFTVVNFLKCVDGKLNWPSWLTYSGQFTHKVVTCQP